MPLTVERSGVLRERRRKVDYWFIVDPEAAHPDVVIAEWRARRQVRLPWHLPPVNDVRSIDESVFAWATDETPLTDLWQLTVALARVDTVREALAQWDIRFGSYFDRVEAALPSVVECELHKQYFVEMDALRAVASRLKYEIVDELVAPPVELVEVRPASRPSYPVRAAQPAG